MKTSITIAVSCIISIVVSVSATLAISMLFLIPDPVAVPSDLELHSLRVVDPDTGDVVLWANADGMGGRLAHFEVMSVGTAQVDMLNAKEILASTRAMLNDTTIVDAKIGTMSVLQGALIANENGVQIGYFKAAGGIFDRVTVTDLTASKIMSNEIVNGRLDTVTIIAKRIESSTLKCDKAEIARVN